VEFCRHPNPTWPEFAVFIAAQEELHNRRDGDWSASPFDPAGRRAQDEATAAHHIVSLAK